MTGRLLISFSGGETSAYMTRWLMTHPVYPPYDEIVVVFANTGQESEATLEFVRRCDDHLGFGTVWIEAVTDPRAGGGTGFRVVTFATASRDGEPFEAAIKKYGVPNTKFKDCTRNLKRRPIEAYARSLGWGGDYETAIGIRSDEVDRMSVNAFKNRIVYPLVELAPTTKAQINAWWRAQPFRLELRGYQGNCKWCWKKSMRKHLTLMGEDPRIYDFPERMEREHGRVGPEFKKDGVPADYRRTFFRGNRSVEDLRAMYASRGAGFVPAADDAQVFFDEALDVGAGCEESCEVFSDEDEGAAP